MARSAARLAAVQALYQIDMTGATPDSILKDVLERRIANLPLAEDVEGEREGHVLIVEPDVSLLSVLICTAVTHEYDIDLMINRSLSSDWNPERLEIVVRCILRAGIGELLERLDIPVRVIISEYVDVAHAFYSGSEPGLVNAVLDRLGRHLRAREFDRLEEQDHEAPQ
ncbi:Transcription termination protein NusB [invertebrate metagenome]|uniref:Transcription termination protein NusB n=1 Tax=invertebrate metagenome TaxID=1711999 RepID=A0A484H6P1_9ZZZZ